MNNNRSSAAALGSADPILIERIFGCFLNSKPASMDVSPISGLARVRAKDGSDSACYNWSVVRTVMTRHGGNFLTREASDLRVTFDNPVAAALHALGVI